MMDFIASSLFFFVVLLTLVIGAVGSLMLKKRDHVSNVFGNSLAIIGSLLALIFSGTLLIASKNIYFSFESAIFSSLKFSFNIDALASFFIFIISLIAFVCSIYALEYAKHFYGKCNLGVLGFFYNILILSLILIVTSANALFFLIAWEVMSISSYFLVVYDRSDPENVKAGRLYLIMTYVATSFLIMLFLLIYKYVGSFNFEVIRSNADLIPSVVKSFIFILALVGLGTKAGIIPFHVWLPFAHPAAPSHISGLMSGVMIKTGIYMMIRLFLDLFSPVPLWLGITVLIIGAFSSLLGVLYALTEHDIKRLLAFHSIENIGIILLGIGSSMTFLALGLPTLALLALTAGLFHTFNHAIFKSLLFLSAGSVVNQMHTRNMEEYGGLIKYMPQTAMFFLIGSMAISALPPFNGFFSEWLTFQALFAGIAQLHLSLQWIFILAAGSLAFTGGLALACFVKAFGAIFLARPRSKEVLHAKESALLMQIAMGSLALISLLVGIFSGIVVKLLEKVGQSFNVFKTTPSLIHVSKFYGQNFQSDFASVSAPTIFAFLFLVFLMVLFIVKLGINKKQKIIIGSTWDCGTNLTSRMEITATGFARSIVIIFQGILRPSIQHDVEYHDSKSRYLQKSSTVIMHIGNVYQNYFYGPLNKMIVNLALQSKKIQSGNINSYILYIFIALIVALFSVL